MERGWSLSGRAAGEAGRKALPAEWFPEGRRGARLGTPSSEPALSQKALILSPGSARAGGGLSRKGDGASGGLLAPAPAPAPASRGASAKAPPPWARHLQLPPPATPFPFASCTPGQFVPPRRSRQTQPLAALVSAPLRVPALARCSLGKRGSREPVLGSGRAGEAAARRLLAGTRGEGGRPGPAWRVTREGRGDRLGKLRASRPVEWVKLAPRAHLTPSATPLPAPALPFPLWGKGCRLPGQHVPLPPPLSNRTSV